MTESTVAEMPVPSSQEAPSQPQPDFLQQVQQSKTADSLKAQALYSETIKLIASSQPPQISPSNFSSLIEHLGRTDADVKRDVQRVKDISQWNESRVELQEHESKLAEFSTRHDELEAKLAEISRPLQEQITEVEQHIHYHYSRKDRLVQVPEPSTDSIPSEYLDYVDSNNTDSHQWERTLSLKATRLNARVATLRADLAAIQSGEPATSNIDQSSTSPSNASRVEAIQGELQDVQNRHAEAERLRKLLIDRRELLANWIDKESGCFVPQLSPGDLPKIRLNKSQWGM